MAKVTAKTEQGTEIELEITKKEKKSFKDSWMYKHRVGVMRTLTVVAGLVTLDLTYRKGVKDGYEMAGEKVIDMIDDVKEELIPEVVEDVI